MANWVRRSTRKAENREALVRAATELFAEKGYWGVSLDEVADRAGLTKGAVYSSFESKEALLLEVAGRAAINVEPPDTTAPLRSEMRKLGRAVGRLVSTGRLRAIVPRELELSTLALTSETVRTALVRAGRAQRRAFADLLGAFSGSRKDLALPAAEVAAILSAVRSGLMRMRLLDPDAIPVHYFEDAFELIATGRVTKRRTSQ